MTGSAPRLESRWGTALVMIGVAVGLGNVWRFPYMMGQYGGGAFLALYLLAMVLFGVPALIAEWTLGRATRKGPPGAYALSGMPAGRFVGLLVFVIVGMATSYYVLVIGWVFLFLFRSVTVGFAADGGPSALAAMLDGGLLRQAVATVAVLAACGLVVIAGLKRGIERVSRLFVPVFFVLTLALVTRSLTLPGAGRGVRYLLTFDPTAITATTVLAVIGQAAFSLALGGTFMVIYGAYLDRSTPLLPLAIQTAGGDLVAALLATFLVVPAVFAAGIEPSSGPTLLFETLPVVFAAIPQGNVVAAVFFLSLGLVAFLSAVGAVEVLVTAVIDVMGWTRARATWTVVAVEAVLAVPAMLSLEYLAKSDLIWGSTGQPLGSLCALVAVAWCLGRAKALENSGLASRSRLASLWLFWIRYVVPVGVVLALISGWIEN